MGEYPGTIFTSLVSPSGLALQVKFGKADNFFRQGMPSKRRNTIARARKMLTMRRLSFRLEAAGRRGSRTRAPRPDGTPGPAWLEQSLFLVALARLSKYPVTAWFGLFAPRRSCRVESNPLAPTPEVIQIHHLPDSDWLNRQYRAPSPG
jgi:hypothetical protein